MMRLFSAYLFALTLSSCSQSAIPFRLRLLCLDLSRGQVISETDRDTEGWARTIRRAVPDLVTLHGIPDGPAGADRVRALARSTGLHGTLAAPPTPQGRETGPGVLSRWPIGVQETYHWDGDGPSSSVAIVVELDSSMRVLPAKAASRGAVKIEPVPLKFLAIRLGNSIETGEGVQRLETIVPRRGQQLAMLSGQGAGTAFSRFLGKNWSEAVHVAVRSPTTVAGRLFCYPRSRWKIVHAAPIDGDWTDLTRSLVVVLELID